MHIREATPADIPVIETLRSELNAERDTLFNTTRNFHERTVPHDIQVSKEVLENEVWIVSVVDDTIVGFIAGSLHVRPNHVQYTLGYIDELFVQKKHRKSGVATILFSALEQAFKDRGCDHVTTHTDAENTTAQRYYETQGMQPVTIEYWKTL